MFKKNPLKNIGKIWENLNLQKCLEPGIIIAWHSAQSGPGLKSEN